MHRRSSVSVAVPMRRPEFRRRRLHRRHHHRHRHHRHRRHHPCRHLHRHPRHHHHRPRLRHPRHRRHRHRRRRRRHPLHHRRRHRHRHHLPRRRRHRRPRRQSHSNRHRNVAAHSLDGLSTRHSVYAVARLSGWAAACTTRRGSRPKPAAGSTALACVQRPNCLSISGADAATMPSTCGCGRSASTRCRHLCARMRTLDASAWVRSPMAVDTTMPALRSARWRACCSMITSISQAVQQSTARISVWRSLPIRGEAVYVHALDHHYGEARCGQGRQHQ